jgi:hypothetical protein
MICVTVDDLTPCLIDTSTGEIVETEVIQCTRKSFLAKYNKSTQWYVNWSTLLDENEVYAIVTKGSVSIQGLVAVRKDENMKSAFITWMVAAPHNNPVLLKRNEEEKKFKGVGGHLFAVAAQRSSEWGYGGAIGGFAASQELMEHYCSVFGAEAIGMLHPYQIFIPEAEAKKIMEAYDYEWTNDRI